MMRQALVSPVVYKEFRSLFADHRGKFTFLQDIHMRLTFFFCALLLGVSASAQNWCPTGAVWNHTYYGCLGCTDTGYVHTAYAGDTLFQGSTCQILDATKHSWDIYTGIYTVEHLGPQITRGQNDLVEKWNGSSFDTLFHFASAPGDSWYPLGMGMGVVTVLDTGHAVVDGLSLRYLVMDMDLGLGTTDTVFARMGFLHYYVDGNSLFYADLGLGPLRCYLDDQIDYSTGMGPACEFTLGSGQRPYQGHCGLFPNPGSGAFTLSYHAQSVVGELQVRDLSGRIVLRERIPQWSTAHRVVLDHAAEGLYMCRIQWQELEATLRIIVDH